MTQEILLPNGKNKQVLLQLEWDDAVAATLYPLHQNKFVAKRDRHAKSVPPAHTLAFAEAWQKHGAKITQETALRLTEFLHDHFPARAVPLVAKARATPLLTVSSAHLKNGSAIQRLVVHLAYRPTNARHDHRMAFVLSV